MVHAGSGSVAPGGTIVHQRSKRPSEAVPKRPAQETLRCLATKVRHDSSGRMRKAGTARTNGHSAASGQRNTIRSTHRAWMVDHRLLAAKSRTIPDDRRRCAAVCIRTVRRELSIRGEISLRETQARTALRTILNDVELACSEPVIKCLLSSVASTDRRACTTKGLAPRDVQQKRLLLLEELGRRPENAREILIWAD